MIDRMFYNSMVGAILLLNTTDGAEFYVPEGFSDNGLALAHSRMLIVSSDGPTLIGPSRFHEATNVWGTARWTADHDVYDIGRLAGNNRTTAARASDDLSVVFGSTYNELGTPNSHEDLFRWTAEDGLVNLGRLRNADGEHHSTMIAYDVTPDGSTVVGARSAFGADAAGVPTLAFRWTAETGLMQVADGRAVAVSDDGRIVLGDGGGSGVFRWSGDADRLTIAADGRATGLSANGSVAVGWSYDVQGREQAFHWSEDSGLKELGIPDGRIASYAHAVSSDGSVVAGTTGEKHENYGNEIFRWTDESGIVVMNPPDGEPFDSLSTFGPFLSSSGDTIVGTGWSRDDAKRRGPFIWRKGHGTKFLSDVLADEFGLADHLDDWSLMMATAISSDGTTIAGIGTPKGVDDRVGVWVAVIPEPASSTLLAIGAVTLLVGARFPSRRNNV